MGTIGLLLEILDRADQPALRQALEARTKGAVQAGVADGTVYPLPRPAGSDRREMTSRLKVVRQIVLDSILVASVIWIVLYPFSDQPPPLRLFTTILIYTLAIATPAHVILGYSFPLTWGGPAAQWTVFVVLLATIAAAGSVAATLIVVGMKLGDRNGVWRAARGELEALRVLRLYSSASSRPGCNASGTNFMRPR